MFVHTHPRVNEEAMRIGVVMVVIVSSGMLSVFHPADKTCLSRRAVSFLNF